MSSTIQREIKSLVDKMLKTSETKSLKFTRVSVKASDKGLEVSIKIYLEHPMRLNSIYELVRIMSNKYGVATDEVTIYSPHSGAIRLSFIIKK
ncbi:hypothetical protein JCM16161A_16250 [Vulcanisaeta sp. JCM 16161]|uniref:hypothetical protein n=1 Tax=Vulcanisaeta sp. JCM 16161 TaxID=1295372 RepID=UPI0006D214B0|nr:hypothetical protein [Vulcanisaeta sp. JCM 16161]